MLGLSAPYSIRRAAAGAVSAGLALLAATGCGGASHHHTTIPTSATGPTVRPATARPPLLSIFEDPARVLTAPGPTLDELRSLGVQYVRVMVSWAGVAPAATSTHPPAGFGGSSPSAYPQSGWAPYDQIVRLASARGIGVDLDPTAPAPRWATGSGEPRGAPPGVWKPSARLFGQFVSALGTRYSGHYTPPGASAPLPRVHFWSVWNEPNYGQDLAPQSTAHGKVEVSPALYRGLLGASWSALHATGHGSDTILVGELAPRGLTGGGFPGLFAGMVPLRFLRALYCVDGSLHKLSGPAARARGCPPTTAASARFAAANPALFSATGLAVHPYSQGAVAPDVRTAGEPDYADLASLPRLEQMLDAIQRDYGSSRRWPLYSTEYGYKTDPPFVAGAPLATAAAYLNWAEYLSWVDPRIRSFDQYLLADPPPSGPSQFDTGLEFANGTPKPSLAAYRMPLFLPRTTAARGQPLEVWGCVRPVAYASGLGADQAQIQFRAGSGGRFSTVRTVRVSPAECYFDVRVAFPGSGVVRVAWKYPGGPVIHSRVVSIAVR